MHDPGGSSDDACVFKSEIINPKSEFRLEVIVSGHSRWANIKHKKAKSDAKKGKIWSKCARAIIVAARNGGGDPDMNLTLRYAVDDAKAANMPKDTIEKAIKKGTGELGGENYESVVYEGYGPNGVAFYAEALTDNRNRTAGELRVLFSKLGGNLGATGSVAFVFNHRGLITVARDAIDEDAVIQAALDAGAQDVTDEGDFWQILTDPTDFHAVRTKLEAAGMEFQLAEITMMPANTVTCTGDDARKVLALIESLEDNDDVQKVYANFDIPDDELAAMES
jgi:YebC/PmpR family DNA-binding regulatory protein